MSTLIRLSYNDDQVRRSIDTLKPSARFETIPDQPALVKRVHTRTGQRFFSREKKAPDGSWSVLLLTEDQEQELGVVDDLPAAKATHRSGIQLLIAHESRRRAADRS